MTNHIIQFCDKFILQNINKAYDSGWAATPGARTLFYY